MNIQWKIKRYNELTIDELYNILKIRAEVFVVEQNCVYQDIDDKDIFSFHLIGIDTDIKGHKNIIAYLRILPPKTNYHFKEASIGRVMTVNSVRNQGLGKELVERGIEFTEKEYKGKGIRISGQLYLEKFYNDLGFKTVSDVYLEDGIKHVEMLKSV